VAVGETGIEQGDQGLGVCTAEKKKRPDKPAVGMQSGPDAARRLEAAADYL
jgi:hypothetical protein